MSTPIQPQDPLLSKITVLIVDDYPIWRRGLRHVLAEQSHIEVLGEADNGKAALKAARELHPDVILLDVNLPDLNGIQVATRLQEERNTAAVIMLAAYDDDTQAYHAMQAGCAAYCPKDVSPQTLLAAIQAVIGGRYVIRDAMYSADELTDWLRSRVEVVTGMYVVRDHEQLDHLSPREMEILEHITHGHTNRQIAQELAISYQTVKNHVSSILAKLGVHDRMQAALYAIRRGWVRLSDEDEHGRRG